MVGPRQVVLEESERGELAAAAEQHEDAIEQHLLEVRARVRVGVRARGRARARARVGVQIRVTVRARVEVGVGSACLRATIESASEASWDSIARHAASSRSTWLGLGVGSG